jgi:hypothetical protein
LRVKIGNFWAIKYNVAKAPLLLRPVSQALCGTLVALQRLLAVRVQDRQKFENCEPRGLLVVESMPPELLISPNINVLGARRWK